MLSAIFSAVGGQIVDGLLGRVTGLFESYFKKQISLEELKAGVTKAMLETFRDIEVAHAEALAKTYESFMSAMKTSKLLQWAWAIVVFSQLFILCWHQFFIPLIVATGIVTRYPSSGSTVEWSYLLLAALLGMGPVVLRAGPGAGNLKDKLKSLVGR